MTQASATIGITIRFPVETFNRMAARAPYGNRNQFVVDAVNAHLKQEDDREREATMWEAMQAEENAWEKQHG